MFLNFRKVNGTSATGAQISTISQAEMKVSELMEHTLPVGYSFHNIEHTRAVVQAVEFLCTEYHVSQSDCEAVTIAAWFHDVGHVKGYVGHEETSERYAKDFLKNAGWSIDRIQLVLSCIRATRMPQEPENLLGQIICDADLFHLASEHYLDYLERLREEWAAILGKHAEDRDWILDNLEFLGQHNYFTVYGQQVLERGKERNMQTLQALL